MSQVITTLGVECDPRGFQAGSQVVQRELNSMRGRARTFVSDLGSGFDRVKSAVFNLQNSFAMLGAGFTAYKYISQLAEFEGAVVDMARVTDRALTDVEKDVMSLSAALGSPIELMKGYYNVLSAGITDAAEALKIMQVASKASQAAHVDQEATITALTKLMFGYGGEIRDAMEAADLMFAIEKVGQTTFMELVPVIGSLAAISHTLAVSSDELGASLSIVSQTAGSTAEAATQVEAILSALMKPTSEMEAVLKKMGYTAFETAIKEKGFVQVLREIVGQTDGTSLALGNLFGRKEAIQGLVTLMTNNFGEVNRAMEEMKNKSGTTEQAFERYLTTIGGKTRILMNEFQRLTISMTGLGEEGIKSILDTGIGVVRVLEGMEDPLDRNIESFRTLAKVVESVGVAVAGIGAFAAGRGLFALFGGLGPAGWGVAGTIAAISALVAYRKEIRALYDDEYARERAWSEQQAMMKAQSEHLDKLIPEYRDLTSKTHLTTAEQLRLNEVMRELRRIVPDLAYEIDRYGTALKSLPDFDKTGGLNFDLDAASHAYNVAKKEMEGVRDEIEKTALKYNHLQNSWRQFYEYGKDLTPQAKTSMLRYHESVKDDLDDLLVKEQSASENLRDARDAYIKAREEFDSFVTTGKTKSEWDAVFKGIGESALSIEEMIRGKPAAAPAPPPDMTKEQRQKLLEYEDFVLRLEQEINDERRVLGLEGIEERIAQVEVERDQKIRELEEMGRQAINVQRVNEEARLEIQERYLAAEAALVQQSEIKIQLIREEAQKEELKKLEDETRQRRQALEGKAELYRMQFEPEYRFDKIKQELAELREAALITPEVETSALAAAEEEMARAQNQLLMNTRQWSAGVQVALDDYAHDATDAARNFYQAWSNALKKTEDELVDFFMTGKLGFQELMQSITSDIIRTAVRQSITGPLAEYLKPRAPNWNPFAGSVGNLAGGNLVQGACNLFGSLGNLFGGFFAEGGEIHPGKFYVTGEKGPEIILPKQPAQVIPLKVGSEKSPEITINQTPGPPVPIIPRNENSERGSEITINQMPGPPVPIIPRQAGGPVLPGNVYLTGEKGPEIIVPKQAGTVLPNFILQLLERLGQPGRPAYSGGAALRQSPIFQTMTAMSGAFLGLSGVAFPAMRDMPSVMSNPIQQAIQRFGSVMNPLHRETGGALQPGNVYLTGEKGPEILIPNQPGTVLPNNLTRALGMLGNRMDDMARWRPAASSIQEKNETRIDKIEVHNTYVNGNRKPAPPSRQASPNRRQVVQDLVSMLTAGGI